MTAHLGEVLLGLGGLLTACALYLISRTLRAHQKRLDLHQKRLDSHTSILTEDEPQI